MHYRTFGRTGIKVSEIGHGTWTMGSMWGARDDAEAIRSLTRSIELGVNFIDTAYVYGDGHSEQLIEKVLRETGQKVFVATKIPPKNYQWPARHHVPVAETFPADHIFKYTEISLKNLKMDCVDLQQLHVWSDSWILSPSPQPSPVKGEGIPSGNLDWLDGVEKLKKQGKIRFFGVSINDHEPDSALKIVDSGIVDSVQVIYNIFDQTPEEKLFPLCRKKNVAVIARVPFDEGSLTGTLTPDMQFPKGDWRVKYFTPERLKETCQRIEALKATLSPALSHQGRGSLAQIALKFCLAHPAVSTVIPGMRKVAHVEDCVGASDGKNLSSELMGKLKQQAWNRNFYPNYG